MALTAQLADQLDWHWRNALRPRLDMEVSGTPLRYEMLLEPSRLTLLPLKDKARTLVRRCGLFPYEDIK